MPAGGRAEGIAVVQRPSAALVRWWCCPRCTLNNALSRYECEACGWQRPRPPRPPRGSSGRAEVLAVMALRGKSAALHLQTTPRCRHQPIATPPPPPAHRRHPPPLPLRAAAVASLAGLALGRASSHQRGLQRLAMTALAVAAVPIANALLGCLFGWQPPSGGTAGPITAAAAPPRHPAAREQRRRQLRRAAQQAAEEAAAAGSMGQDELRLLQMVVQVGVWSVVVVVAGQVRWTGAGPLQLIGWPPCRQAVRGLQSTFFHLGLPPACLHNSPAPVPDSRKPVLPPTPHPRSAAWGKPR